MDAMKDSRTIVMEELSRIGRLPMSGELTELDSYRITTETVLPPMRPLFQMFDVPCFYRGELVADCGKAKSGKTFFLSILMTAGLTQRCMALERHTESTEGTEPLAPLRILWVDTEQSQQSTQEIITQRVVPMIKGNTEGTEDTEAVCNDYLFAYNLRGLGYDARGRMVDAAISDIRPDICIIDGIKDLMTDINNAEQATQIMEKLMAMAKETNSCIVCVLHQNKAEQDRNMRGSIGTELTNKAFEVFQCDVVGETDVFKVTHTLSRKQKMKQRLYYRISSEGLPVEQPGYQEQPRSANGRWASTKSRSASHAGSTVMPDLRKLFTTAMEGRTQKPFGEVMAVALKKGGVLDAKTYYAYVSEAEEQGIIRKEVHPETGATWVVLVDNALPF